MRKIAIYIGCCGAVLLAGGAWARADALGDLMKALPGDKTVAVVLVDPISFDRTMTAVRRRFDEKSTEGGLLEELRREIPFAQEVDFSKPMGLVVSRINNDWGEPVLWLANPKGVASIKGIEGATEENGVWTLPSSGKLAKVVGSFVLLCDARDALDDVSSSKRSLAEAMKGRTSVVAGCDVFARFDMASLRTPMKRGIEQARQVAPMFAMVAAQGGDPAQSTNVIRAMINAADRFVDQVGGVVVGGRLTADAANVTISVGFEPGPIRDYLAKQKAASREVFAHIKEQPYFAAMAFEMPGEGSPFLDYVLAEIAKGPGGSDADGGETESAKAEAGEEDAVGELVEASVEYYRLMRGGEAVVAFGDSGMTTSGYYFTDEPASFISALRRSLKSADALMKAMSPGVSYEEVGTRKHGDIEVVEFTMAADPDAPQAQAMAAIYGKDVRFAFAAMRGRVAYCMGPEGFRRSFFTGKIDRPFASNTHVKNSLAALPKKSSAVILMDPAGMLPLIAKMAPMIGGGMELPKLPPGPAIAVGLTLAGEAARMDIYVPFKAIKRVMTALEHDSPM